MKIAFIGHKGYPSLYGGVEKVVEELANRLADKGHECLVYSRKYYTQGKVDHPNIKRIVVKGIKTRRLDTLSHTFMSLMDVLKRDVDVVTIHSFGNAILNFIPKIFNKPVVMHLHGFEWGQTRFNFIERNILLRLPLITLKYFSDEITSVSLEQHNELLKRKIKNKFLPNGVDINSDPKVYKDKTNYGKYFLFVGRIAYQKGIDHLIRAYNLSGVSKYKLKIVGWHDDAEEYFNYLLGLTENNPNIEFLGYKYGSELESIYRKASCIVIPSETEQCPMVLLESLAFNKCIIASKIPGIYNIAQDAVLYFKNKDHIGLAKIMRKISEEPAIIDDYEKKVVDSNIMSQFDWNNIVDNYEEIYYKILLKKLPKIRKLNLKVEKKDLKTNGLSNQQVTLSILDDIIQPYRLKHKVYYNYLRPNMPLSARQNLQKIYRKNTSYKPNFIDSSIVDTLDGNLEKVKTTLYPQNKKTAIILTHDIDTYEGFSIVPKIVELTRDQGFRSCWYIIPYKYKIDAGLIRLIQEAGDEIGIHGYNHDGKLFSSEKIFNERAEYINEALKKYNAKGFRSPMVHRNLDWLSRLNIEYDASCFDYDPFQPFPGGSGFIWPFIYKNIVELPYTIPQDHTLFYELKKNNIDIWIKKIEWLLKHNGMILSITHPDYLKQKNYYEHYRLLLDYLNSIDETWKCLPHEMAAWWKNKETPKQNIIQLDNIINELSMEIQKKVL